MKTITTIMLGAAIVCASMLSNAQPQLKKWYIPDQQVDLTISPPTVSTIQAVQGNASAPAAIRATNGMYDSNGQLMFYACIQSNIEIRDRNNNVIKLLYIF